MRFCSRLGRARCKLAHLSDDVMAFDFDFYRNCFFTTLTSVLDFPSFLISEPTGVRTAIAFISVQLFPFLRSLSSFISESESLNPLVHALFAFFLHVSRVFDFPLDYFAQDISHTVITTPSFSFLSLVIRWGGKHIFLSSCTNNNLCGKIFA
jgi:hypothetical protein